jgi:hypothetical protein
METSFNKKLKKKKQKPNAGRIISLGNPEHVKKKSEWKKVDVSRVINRNFPTMGIMSFEELDPSEFFGNKQAKSDAPTKRKRIEASDIPSVTLDQDQVVKPKPPSSLYQMRRSHPYRRTKKEKDPQRSRYILNSFTRVGKINVTSITP